VPQDAADDSGVFDHGDEPEAPAAPRTRQHIKPERPSHERRPAPSAPVAAILVVRIGSHVAGGVGRLAWGRVGGFTMNHFRPAAGPGTEYAVYRIN
jgi:hypothetical protein